VVHGAPGGYAEIDVAALSVAEVQARVAVAGVEARATDRDRDLHLRRLAAREWRGVRLDHDALDLRRRHGGVLRTAAPTSAATLPTIRLLLFRRV
jgi:hypothetical protein